MATGTPQRTYEETHPWLTFRVDLRNAGPDLWMLLGEARSKIEHIAGSLLKPEVAREMHIVYLAKGVVATTAIEGNTLSEDDARKLVEGRLEVPPSQEYMAREMHNIIAAYNQISNELIAGVAEPLSRDVIENYNRTILNGLELPEGVVAGEIPDRNVVVGNYRGAPRKDCGYLLDRLCEWLNGPDFEPRSEDWAMGMAILKAVIAHLYLAWIHPFGDGNGRTARLVELRILLEAGVPTPATHLLSNHYHQTRPDYYRKLHDASRANGGELSFTFYALRGFVDGLREQLGKIRSQVFEDRWEQHIYQSFGHANTSAAQRRRRLMLELSKRDEPETKAGLRRLSPELIEAYAGKTDKTLTRDVNALIGMDLLRRILGRLYIPNRSILEAFRPPRADKE